MEIITNPATGRPTYIRVSAGELEAGLSKALELLEAEGYDADGWTDPDRGIAYAHSWDSVAGTWGHPLREIGVREVAS